MQTSSSCQKWIAHSTRRWHKTVQTARQSLIHANTFKETFIREKNLPAARIVNEHASNVTNELCTVHNDDTTKQSKQHDNQRHEHIQNVYSRKILTRCKNCMRTRKQLSQMNCEHRTTTQHSSYSTQSIIHSTHFKKHIFRENNLHAARIEREHASSCQKWNAHSTRQCHHKIVHTARQLIIHRRHIFSRDNELTCCTNCMRTSM